MVFPGHGIAWKDFLKALKEEFTRDRITTNAAALTFFGVLALFPFLLFLVTLAGVVMKPQQVEDIIKQLGQVAPGDVTKIVGQQIRSIHQGQNVGLLTVGFLGAIWSASGGVTSLMTALNDVYDVEEGRPFWKVRGIAILTTLSAGFAVLLAALAGVVAGPIADAVGGPIGTAITLLRLPIAGVIMMLVWAFCYWVLPDVEQRFKFITPGSVMGVVLWVIASWGFSFYVSHFGSYNKTYGAIGGVIVLLMWMWISTIVLLTGAEINAVVEHLSPEGKRTGAKSMQDTGADLPESMKDGTIPAPEGLPTRKRRRFANLQASWKKAAVGAGLAYLYSRKQRHA